jgi:hypothetical protein
MLGDIQGIRFKMEVVESKLFIGGCGAGYSNKGGNKKCRIVPRCY